MSRRNRGRDHKCRYVVKHLRDGITIRVCEECGREKRVIHEQPSGTESGR